MPTVAIITFLIIGILQMAEGEDVNAIRESTTGHSDNNNVVIGPISLRVPLGHIMLVRKDSEYCAIKFTRFWTGKTAEDRFAKYESYFQGDKSGDFLNMNVQVRKEELSSPKPWGIGRFSFSFGNRNVLCGHIKLEWTGEGWVYFTGSDQREGDYGIELAATQWTNIVEVNVFDPRLKWYRYDPKRRKKHIPIDKLWEESKQKS